MMRNTKFVYAVQAYDLDNDALTFSLTYGPSGMTMSSTGTLEWVPNSGGTYSVILKVTDGLGLSTSQSFSIKVYADNQQPKIMSLPPIGSVRLNETLVYPIEAIDPDGDTLSYQVAQIYYPVYASCYTCPPAYYLPAPTGNYEVLMSSYGRFQFTPKAYCTPFTTCNYLVIVSVVDGRGAVSQQSFNISIDISNRAPVITSRPPTDHISRYTIFTYQLEASDPDGDPVSFALLQGPKHISTTTNDMTLDVVTGYLEWNTSGFGSGVYPVVIEAMDGRGMKTQQSFSITVSENAAAMCAGTPVRFYAKVGLPFRIVEDGCQNYTCTFTSAPTGVSFDGATLKWTPTSVQVGTRIISVHRNSGLSSDWSYCVDVLANSSPVFVSIPPAGAVAGKYFSYQLQVEDSENDVRNYQLIDGPAGLSMNLHTGLLSGVPTQAGKYNVTVQATTWDNYYVRQTFELHVLAAEIVVTVSTEYYRANNIPSGVEETIYVHSDMAGSPLARTDAGGDLVSRTEYSPYGEQLGGASGTLDDKISFAGHSVDENIGLSYMGARYYEPFVGRFMGMDPLGFDELNLHSLNRYIYANNNPYKFVDPNGLESINLNLGVGFGPGFNLGISIDPQTGNVYAIGGIGVGVGLAATSTYSSATPVQGYSWNFEGAAGLPGAVPVGGTVSASWDASAYSSTGQHMLSLGESVGYGMGAGFAVTGTFQGSWEIGNLGDSINWWMDLLGFSQGLPPYLCY
jgi:RHS repeat-associated protein